MKKLLATVALLGVLSTPATAEFVLNDNIFADLGATGFGNAPRLLTLQNTPIQSGAVVSNGGAVQFLSPITIDDNNNFAISGTICTSNGTCSGGGLRTGTNESTLVNVTTLWNDGASVGVGLDTNQIGSTGALLFNELVLNIYTSNGTLLGTFGGNDPVLISEQLLALQQGNGNSVFNLNLTAGEQAEYDTILAGLAPGTQIFAGLAAAFGCSPVPCIGASNDGAESFLAFDAQAVPGPIVGAGIPGLIAACSGMVFLARRRKKLGMA